MVKCHLNEISAATNRNLTSTGVELRRKSIDGAFISLCFFTFQSKVQGLTMHNCKQSKESDPFVFVQWLKLSQTGRRESVNIGFQATDSKLVSGLDFD